MSKTLKFKNTLYNIIDSGDIGNGWKYVEVIDKKQAFSLPKCLYYKGKSMKNLLSYTDYVNHLDMGKDFINDFVKDIFRECYPGSKNPICKVKESLMVGGGDEEDIKKLKNKETVKGLWDKFDVNKDGNIDIGESSILEDLKNTEIYEIIQKYLKMKRENAPEKDFENSLPNETTPDEKKIIKNNFDKIYEELYQKEKTKTENKKGITTDDIELEEKKTEEGAEITKKEDGGEQEVNTNVAVKTTPYEKNQGENTSTDNNANKEEGGKQEGANQEEGQKDEGGKQEVNTNVAVKTTPYEKNQGENTSTDNNANKEEGGEQEGANQEEGQKDEGGKQEESTQDNNDQLPEYLAKLFDISGGEKGNLNDDTIVYFKIKNDLDVTDKLLHLNDKNKARFDEFLYKDSDKYKEKLINLIKKIEIQKNDKYYMLEPKEELKTGNPKIFRIIEKLIVRDIIKTQTHFTKKKNEDKENKSHFLH